VVVLNVVDLVREANVVAVVDPARVQDVDLVEVQDVAQEEEAVVDPVRVQDVAPEEDLARVPDVVQERHAE